VTRSALSPDVRSFLEQVTAANEPMIRAAKKVGFVEEGVLRQASWSLGSFEDALIMGLLAQEWNEPRA
jgi:RimJ/RimL family protein N-acetyltransferase